MWIYYSTLISTFLFGLCSRFKGESIRINRELFASLTILVFILVAGLRANIGDTSAYIHGYESLSSFKGIDENSKDVGFIIFQLILYNISQDPQFMIFITSLITQFFIVYTLYKYRSYLELEVYMYITCGIFLVTMNGIRQAMVGAILFFCTTLITQKKFLQYMIITIILSTMHSSALIMIPVYFIVNKPAWSKTTLIILISSVIGFIFFYELMPTFFDILGNSSYTEYEALMSEDNVGSSLMRVIVNAVPVLLAYIKRNELKEQWTESDIFVNMSIINLIFNAFGIYNWIFVRFQLYFQYYNIVLLPFIISKCFKSKEERNLIYYLFVICYFIFFYYEQIIGFGGIKYISNYIKF